MTGIADEPVSGGRPSANLAKWYWIYAGVVGGVVLLDGLIGGQGAGSGDEAAEMLLVAVLQPVPMLVLGLIARFGWRWVTPLAVALPVALAVGIMMAPGSPEDGTAGSQFVFDLGYTQRANLPGAIVLAIVALRLALRERKGKAVVSSSSA